MQFSWFFLLSSLSSHRRRRRLLLFVLNVHIEYTRMCMHRVASYVCIFFICTLLVRVNLSDARAEISDWNPTTDDDCVVIPLGTANIIYLFYSFSKFPAHTMMELNSCVSIYQAMDGYIPMLKSIYCLTGTHDRRRNEQNDPNYLGHQIRFCAI